MPQLPERRRLRRHDRRRRDDFRDSVVFQLVSTGANGRGSVSFDLPDDLTSWHISATAIASDLRAGSGFVLVPVGLPFFADAILASDYLAGERPVLRVRSFGDALAAGDRVRFTVSAPSLLMAPTSVDAAAFATAGVPLPDLSLGMPRDDDQGDRHRRRRRGRTRSSGRSSSGPAASRSRPPQVTTPGGGRRPRRRRPDDATSSRTPAGAAWSHGSRTWPTVAARASTASWRRTSPASCSSGRSASMQSTLPPRSFDAEPYQRGGVALLPYSSPDESLTAMTAIVAPERINPELARQALDEWLQDGIGDPRAADHRARRPGRPRGRRPR